MEQEMRALSAFLEQANIHDSIKYKVTVILVASERKGGVNEQME